MEKEQKFNKRGLTATKVSSYFGIFENEVSKESPYVKK